MMGKYSNSSNVIVGGNGVDVANGGSGSSVDVAVGVGASVLITSIDPDLSSAVKLSPAAFAKVWTSATLTAVVPSDTGLMANEMRTDLPVAPSIFIPVNLMMPGSAILHTP